MTHYLPAARPTLRNGRVYTANPVAIPSNASVDWTMVGCGLPGFEALTIAQYAGLVLQAAKLGDLRWLEYYAAHARAHGAFDAVAESMAQQAQPSKRGRK